MLYSKYCEYVIKALAYLSQFTDHNNYIMVREISNKLSIPYHFLSKIFQDLTATNWVISKKGKNGGFSLAVDPNKLTLMDIIKWSDGIHNFNKCVLGDHVCGENYRCSLHNRCSSLRNSITEFFDTMTVHDVAEINREHLLAALN
jgi:Rrf2 family transcriptional regulator, iron-sulfur cluster assembly transcription factor